MMNRIQNSNLRFKIAGMLFAILISMNGFAGPKKNFLFIMTDQQRYDALSLAGNTVLETPNLDRLARQGVYF